MEHAPDGPDDEIANLKDTREEYSREIDRVTDWFSIVGLKGENILELAVTMVYGLASKDEGVDGVIHHVEQFLLATTKSPNPYHKH